MRKTAQQRAVDLNTILKLLESIPRWLLVVLPFLQQVLTMIRALVDDAKQEMRGVPPPTGEAAEVV